MDPDRVNRLRFRSWRRGFREADLILGPFADTVGPTLNADELDELERLLDQSDHDIFAWIVGTAPTPTAFDTAIMARLKTFRFVARDARQDLGA
jgi:antitoxin CptB